MANLLYHCDFTAYARLGDSITGATYKNLPRGPYPECLDKELSHIEEMGEGIVVTADHPEAGVKRLVARNSPATATFAEPEVSIIEQVLEGLRKREASASDQPTHVESICQYVDEGEAIPYTLVFVSTEPPSPEAICVAQEVAERLGGSRVLAEVRWKPVADSQYRALTHQYRRAASAVDGALRTIGFAGHRLPFASKRRRLPNGGDKT